MTDFKLNERFRIVDSVTDSSCVAFNKVWSRLSALDDAPESANSSSLVSSCEAIVEVSSETTTLKVVVFHAKGQINI